MHPAPASGDDARLRESERKRAATVAELYDARAELAAANAALATAREQIRLLTEGGGVPAADAAQGTAAAAEVSLLRRRLEESERARGQLLREVTFHRAAGREEEDRRRRAGDTSGAVTVAATMPGGLSAQVPGAGALDAQEAAAAIDDAVLGHAEEDEARAQAEHVMARLVRALQAERSATARATELEQCLAAAAEAQQASAEREAQLLAMVDHYQARTPPPRQRSAPHATNHTAATTPVGPGIPPPSALTAGTVSALDAVRSALLEARAGAVTAADPSPAPTLAPSLLAPSPSPGLR